MTVSFNDNELMRVQASTLYVLNNENKIVRINEPAQASAPIFFVGKTRDSNLILVRHDLPQSIVEELTAATIGSFNITDLCRIVEKYKRVKDVWLGPAYYFNKNIKQDTDQNIVVINETNSHLLSEYFDHLTKTLLYRTPIASYVADGHAVSVCCSARKSNAAAEASLLTVPRYRGMGLAQKVVTKWSNEVYRLGLIPLYSTSWDNLSSQKVAQKLGLIQYGMDFNITVETE
ncbi:GNAT family N-acetyltransferase [Paenibacillus alkalitolerans]|uniref:GNAT family N-acetyltransferase n=1 Tax=Paenibacillus alkalitolerans TaxID=2799335 RepID=UPI0018F4D7D8|nr:GNAT family N-acetyltransferase [Paenibacillus alkalitolerans]